MKKPIFAGGIGRLVHALVAFCALVGATGAFARIAVDTLPRDPRAGDFITLQISGRLPREDFRVLETVLRRLEPVERGSRSYLAEVDIYYGWNPLYISPLVATPYTTSVALGVFDTSADVTVLVRFFPARYESLSDDITTPETASFTVGGGGDGCGNEMVLGGSGACTAALRFGRYAMGERSFAVPVVIRNDGPSTIYFGSFSVNNADYPFTRECGDALEPEERCQVFVAYAPSLDGESPGRLTIRWSTRQDAVPYNQTVATLSGNSTGTRPLEPQTGTRMVEFYAENIDQYVLAGDEKEIAALDRATGVWRRTGVTFMGQGEFGVCRFYGDVPAGPNGHLYIARIDECDALKLQDRLTPRGKPAYRYEGIAFNTSLPPIGVYNGRYTCPADTRAIYQFRRPATGNRDAAYRYVPAGSVNGGPNGDAIARSLLGSGWSYDGHVMCNVDPPPLEGSP